MPVCLGCADDEKTDKRDGAHTGKQIAFEQIPDFGGFGKKTRET